ncbi:ATP-binding protein [Candidatus Micrarchaeota archaeon]|nr:ATP-binding protein [Candidatus Micrarchaeota archaeon]
MTQISGIIEELNPWWKTQFRVDGYREREIYSDIKKFMRLPQIIALTGLRRVGKTTLLLRIVEDAIKGGLDSRNVLYVSFDELKAVSIREVLREYEVLVNRNLRYGKFLVLLDEVQKLVGWQDQLKALYDLYKGRIKFVVSGSESLFIRRGWKESLAGRLFDFKLEPLSFGEFIEFKQLNYHPIKLYSRELSRLFDEFILTQGFPELVGVTDKIVIRKYIRENVIEKVIFRDLPSLLNVKNVSVIESLLTLLIEEPGQIVDISHLAGELGVSRKTLSDYLSYLEQSFLVRKLYNFSRSRSKVERKLRKYYPTVVSPELVFRNDDLSRSRVFEWMIVNQLKAEFFWRDVYKNEVDIVLYGRKPVPIEVKYGKIDTSGLRAFIRRFKVGKGYVVTPGAEETRKVNGAEICIVQAFLFLLGYKKMVK